MTPLPTILLEIYDPSPICTSFATTESKLTALDKGGSPSYAGL